MDNLLLWQNNSNIGLFKSFRQNSVTGLDSGPFFLPDYWPKAICKK